MSELEIESAIEFDSLWQNLVALPEDISQYSIVYQIINRKPSTNQMDILFVATLKSEIKQITDRFINRGMQPVLLDLRPFALRSSLLVNRPDLTGSTFAMVEVGVTENYVLVVGDDNLALAELFVSDQDRMDLQLQFDNEAFLEQFFARMALQINQSLMSVGGVGVDVIKTVYVASDLPNQERWFSYLAHALGELNVILLNPFENAEIVSGNDSEVVHSAYAVALGLASRVSDVFGYFSYQVGVKSVNLLPNHKALTSKRQANAFARAASYASVALCLLIIGVLFFTNEMTISDLKAKTRSYGEVQSELNSVNESIKSIVDEQKQLNKVIKTSSLLTSNQKQLAEAYSAVARVASQYGWLNSISYQDLEIRAIGYARSEQNVMQIVSGLGKNQIFDEVVLGSLELKLFGYDPDSAIDVRAYEIRMLLKPIQADQGSVREAQ